MTVSSSSGVDDGSAADRRIATVVFLTGVSCALHIGKLPVAIPVLGQALALSLVQSGFLLSVVQLAGLALGLLVGVTADRLGARRVMMTGLLTLALGSLVGALAQNAAVLLASRMVEGLGFLWSVLPAPALLRQRVRHPLTLTRALGWWGAYMPMGTAFALLGGVAIIDGFGWRSLWVFLALGSLLAAVALRTWVPPDTVQDDGPVGQFAGLLDRLKRTLRSPGPWAISFAFFFYSGQWMAVVGFLPTIYQQAGYSGWLLGGLTALAAGINMAGNVSAGRWLSRQVPAHRLLMLGYGAMALGGWLAFQSGAHPWLQYAGILLFSSFGGLVPGTLFGIAVRLAPDNATVATTVGWMQQWSALGQFVGPPLVAALAVSLGGWSASGWFTAACSVAGMLVALWIARVLAARRSSPAA
ncbi:MAG: MFS transporter [Burkholderiaceae bacterium]